MNEIRFKQLIPNLFYSIFLKFKQALKKDDNNNYTLNVNITQNMATVAETRLIAIQVDKLPTVKTTKLNLIFRH